MKIYIESNRKARLVNCRVRIVHDSCYRQPWADMDLIFNPRTEDVDSAPLYDATTHDEPLIERKCGALTFYTNKSRIKELCGDDPKFFTDDGIDKLCWGPEKNEIKMWVNGEVFGFVVEHWDEDNRSWKHVDSCFGYYGIDAVLDEVKDIECECICCDDDVKYNIPNGMLASYDPNYLGE